MAFDELLPFCAALDPLSLRPAGEEDRCCFRLLLSGCRGESAEDGFIMVSGAQLCLSNIHPSPSPVSLQVGRETVAFLEPKAPNVRSHSLQVDLAAQMQKKVNGSIVAIKN